MILSELIETLAKSGVNISAKDGALHLQAGKGALTEKLKNEIRLHKANIIQWLEEGDDKNNADQLPAVQTKTQDFLKPFPLADLQVGFYMSDDPYMEFHVRPHYYMEFDKVELDIERYEKAWNQVIARRIGEFPVVNDQGELYLQNNLSPIRCEVRDLSLLPSSTAEQILLGIREKMRRRELPLNKWPWFEVHVSVWLSEGIKKTRIHYNHNNFFCDGYGAVCLLDEVDSYYSNPQLNLPKRTINIRDVLMTLEDITRLEIGKKAKRYWTDRLSNLPPAPDLPRLKKETRIRSELVRREQFLSPEEWQGFKTNAARFGLTPSNAIVAAYCEVLARWSNSSHFVLSHMMTRRMPLHKEVSDMIGNFASLYPLEINLIENTSFAQHAQDIQKQVQQDGLHLHWGGMQVMQQINQIKGEFGRTPYPYVVGSGFFMGKYKKPSYTCLETSQTLLDHQFWELDDGRLYVVWDLIEAFFPEGMIDNMWAYYGEWLTRLAAKDAEWNSNSFNNSIQINKPKPTKKIIDIPITNKLLHQNLNSCKGIFLTDEQGDLTYAELNQWSDNVAKLLKTGQYKTSEVIAVVADRGRELTAATLGIIKSGAAYVPIDPSIPTKRLEHMLENSGAKIVITQKKYSESIHWPKDQIVLTINELPIQKQEKIVLQQNDSFNSQDLAYIIYTSGSTGLPKGVMIDHRGAMNTILDINKRFSVSAEDIVLGVSSFSFDLSVYDLFGVIEAGARLIYPRYEGAQNPAHWVDLLVNHSVTIWNSAPPLMTLLVETALRQKVLLPALRLVLLSGDWIPVDLPDQIKKLAPNAKVVSLGGATEASIWSIYYPIDQTNPNWESIPYGWGMANQEWLILDESGRETPTWTRGELYISGVGLAQGYRNDQEKTDASFIKYLAPGSEVPKRLYKTGDRGRWLPDGSIEFLGRLDSQVKVQGYRIELGEVESCICQYKDVARAVVVAQGDRHSKQLVAFIEPVKSQKNFDESQFLEPLLDFLKEKLLVYMIPSAWSFLESMPLSANGKIDRKKLSATILQKIKSKKVSKQTLIDTPQNSCQKELVNIWKNILDTESIGIHDDFFDLGGQSFDAVRCLAIIKERFNVTLSLGHIWQDRTINKLSMRLHDSTDSESSCMLSITLSEQGTPLFLVHPAGGQIMAYLPLAEKLKRPVYGFVAEPEGGKGIDEGWSIERLAKRYISELKKVQPNGPYSIGGWSSGGVIAYEMVSQLEQMGEQLSEVLMLDCPSPLENDPISEDEMIRGFIEDLGQDISPDIIDHETLSQLSGEERVAKAITLCNDEFGSRLDVSQMTNIFIVFNSVVNAVRRYKPSPINSDLIIVRAKEGSVTEFSYHPYRNECNWGWNRLTTGMVTSGWVAGSHYTFLDRENLDQVITLIDNFKLNKISHKDEQQSFSPADSCVQ